jgi:hypothetical protein
MLTDGCDEGSLPIRVSQVNALPIERPAKRWIEVLAARAVDRLTSSSVELS